ncbi:hypothetical protein EE612_051985 [Oryza sativa]|nr:hypothetical protein EE612_051985 [Oryza sativa]
MQPSPRATPMQMPLPCHERSNTTQTKSRGNRGRHRQCAVRAPRLRSFPLLSRSASRPTQEPARFPASQPSPAQRCSLQSQARRGGRWRWRRRRRGRESGGGWRRWRGRSWRSWRRRTRGASARSRPSSSASSPTPPPPRRSSRRTATPPSPPPPPNPIRFFASSPPKVCLFF